MLDRERWRHLSRLVGELGEMPVAHAEEAVQHLLVQTCLLIGASDALLSFGRREHEPSPDDPMLGWRGTTNVRIGPHATRDAALLDAWYSHRPNLPLDQGILALTRADTACAFRQEDLLAVAPEAQTAVAGLFDACRIGDRIVAGRPLAPGVKVLLAAYRRSGVEPFGEEERDLVAALMNAVGGTARRIGLAFGLIGTWQPLTPRERQVLRHLLEGRSERDSARELGLAERSLHHHVTAVYRKFGTRSRAELLALFLGSDLRSSVRTIPSLFV